MVALYKDPNGKNVGNLVPEESLGNVLEFAGADGTSKAMCQYIALITRVVASRRFRLCNF